MGADSPAPVVTPNVHARVMQEIVLPTIAAMAAEGHPFSGFLYAGLMIDGEGKPRVVEFNARLGDPEAQVLLLRLKTDLLEVLLAATADGAAPTLDSIELQWDRRIALGVVMAAHGYPAAPREGDTIEGLPAAGDDSIVFHAGTARRADGALLTKGGRVLCVAALGVTVKDAQQRAYAALAPIRFAGAQYRIDIGHRALKPR
jgi:phosphoribosylamine--glycine ligase